jgi:hypothetical protein
VVLVCMQSDLFILVLQPLTGSTFSKDQTGDRNPPDFDFSLGI